MIPNPGKALRDLAGHLAMSLAPQIPNAFGATNAGLISLLLTLLADEAESGISRRMTDGAELRALFETAGHAPGQDARERFLGSEPADFSHQAVSTWLDEGMRLLIDLHAWAELEDVALNRRIWDFLYDHTERYKADM